MCSIQEQKSAKRMQEDNFGEAWTYFTVIDWLFDDWLIDILLLCMLLF